MSGNLTRIDRVKKISPKMIEIAKDQVARAFKSRRFLKEKNISIRCDNVYAIASLDIFELYLLFSKVDYWEWKDASGGMLPRQRAWRILLNVILDLILWPFLYVYIKRKIAQRPNIPKNSTSHTAIENSILFLRTDHWFNIKSGGSVGHLSGVIDGFRSLGYVTRVVSTDHLVNVEENEDFSCIFPLYKLGRNVPNFPEMLHSVYLYKKLLNNTKTRRPDFIYQRYSLGNFTGVLLSRALNVPYVCEYNGSFSWMARQWGDKKIFHEKLINKIELVNLQSATCIVVVSRPMRDELASRGIESGKILINPNGVDPDRYSSSVNGERIRNKYGLSNKLVIGFIGTFGKWHGADVLAEAFGLLLNQYPRYKNTVRLLMIGDGQMMPEVKAAISSRHIEHESVLTGLIPQEEGPSYLAACDILASPHVPNPDGTPFFGSPTKLFEYMAMGKPIVASDLDQIGEILSHNKTAYLVKPGESGSLLKGIKMLIDNKDLGDRLGKAARKKIEEEHTWEKHTKKIIDKLNLLLSSSKNPLNPHLN